MPQDIQIRCINKSDRSNPHERIISIGGVNADGARWKRSQQQAIIDIETGVYRYFVNAGGHTVWVIVAVSQWGHKYIKTTVDGEHPNNLLALPECP